MAVIASRTAARGAIRRPGRGPGRCLRACVDPGGDGRDLFWFGLVAAFGWHGGLGFACQGLYKPAFVCFAGHNGRPMFAALQHGRVIGQNQLALLVGRVVTGLAILLKQRGDVTIEIGRRSGLFRANDVCRQKANQKRQKKRTHETNYLL
jgi:hypothetical protein